MASTIKEVVTVASLGKWGPKVGEVFYSWSKKIKEADKGKVVPGGTYNMELYIADSGKRYINSVETNSNVLPVEMPKIVAPIFANTPVAKSFVPKAAKKSEEMTRADWDSKDRRISRQGVIQVAVQVTSHFEEAVILAEKMLGFVNGL